MGRPGTGQAVGARADQHLPRRLRGGRPRTRSVLPGAPGPPPSRFPGSVPGLPAANVCRNARSGSQCVRMAGRREADGRRSTAAPSFPGTGRIRHAAADHRKGSGCGFRFGPSDTRRPTAVTTNSVRNRLQVGIAAANRRLHGCGFPFRRRIRKTFPEIGCRLKNMIDFRIYEKGCPTMGPNHRINFTKCPSSRISRSGTRLRGLHPRRRSDRMAG